MQQMHHCTRTCANTFCLTSQDDISHTESTSAASYAQRKAWGGPGAGEVVHPGGQCDGKCTHPAVCCSLSVQAKSQSIVVLPAEKSTSPSPAPSGVWIGEGRSDPLIAMNASRFPPTTLPCKIVLIVLRDELLAFALRGS